MSPNSKLEACWFYPMWDVTLMLGIYILDNHLRSLRAFQNCHQYYISCSFSQVQFASQILEGGLDL